MEDMKRICVRLGHDAMRYSHFFLSSVACTVARISASLSTAPVSRFIDFTSSRFCCSNLRSCRSFGLRLPAVDFTTPFTSLSAGASAFSSLRSSILSEPPARAVFNAAATMPSAASSPKFCLSITSQLTVVATQSRLHMTTMGPSMAWRKPGYDPENQYAIQPHMTVRPVPPREKPLPLRSDRSSSLSEEKRAIGIAVSAFTVPARVSRSEQAELESRKPSALPPLQKSAMRSTAQRVPKGMKIVPLTA
mmetsp:Transcript_16999/g.28960  ORF Transcript_16999/g.28960 Transcript_16999/m.28960 type:complete len:249 (-) Transcript_16999:437-1183(-)